MAVPANYNSDDWPAMKKLRQEKGVVLIYFALIVFVVFAMLSLLIDVGLARVTQVQMQTAVDGGSLLGLRNQDNTLLTEQQKRELVQEQISWVFDDDLDLDNDERNIGAGPVVPLQAPIVESGKEFENSLNARQGIDTENLGVYDPELQLNVNPLNDENLAVHGDMVRGEYFAAQPHFENSDYTRDDFDHESADPDAFLVRMRRANGVLDSEENVSSSAPPLPYLYGLATPMATVAEGEGPRFEGITVRATAISSTSVAKGIGVALDDEEEEILGAVPFAFQRDFWNELETEPEVPPALFINEDGTIFSDDSLTENIGQMITADAPIFIGNEITQTPSTEYESDGYVAIYNEFTVTGQNLIVGFGRASMSLVTEDTVSEVRVTKFSSQVAFENATALLVQGVENTQVLDQLLTEGEEALLAPVIVR